MKWLVISFAFLPQIVYGNHEGGLVTCHDSSCNFCDFITMVNNIIQWLFSILAVVAVLVLVYAGFLLVTSNGNVNTMQRAKGFFTNVVIGFVIVLAAWLIVDTFMKALVQDTDNFGFWNEFSADCGGVNNPLSN